MSKMIKVLFLIFLAISISLTAQAFLKRALNDAGPPKIEKTHDVVNLFFGLITNKFFLSGLILLIIGFLAWTAALSMADLSFILPFVTAYLYLILFFLSWLLLHENINIWRIVGTCIIVVGTVIIAIWGK